jgi:mannose-6-phosphate isomerase-like protein (cupin superfamily)
MARHFFLQILSDKEKEIDTAMNASDQQSPEATSTTDMLPGWIMTESSAPRPYGPSKEIAPGLRVSSFDGAKLVKKPWGHEIWLHDPTAPYAFKLFIVKKGHQTSLMSHRRKRESYFILAGNGRLHYRQNAEAPDESLEFTAGTVVQIEPGAIHRAEASMTDCIIIEATTPDPDGSDVIRHADDEGRCDGIVASEHA